MLTFAVKKRLRDFTLDLSLEIGTETHVLIGHSGCGKSTTLRILAGLMDPDQGRIELDGRVLLDTKERGRSVSPEDRDVGYLVQSYALFPHLSVTDNIAYGISRLDKGERKKRVEEALDLVGVRPLANARPGSLSGGEQQRVALARALVRRPRFFLLDEPLSALDISTRVRVRGELKTILQGLSIPTIVVTHDYEDARVLGDSIAVMDSGKIVQTGTAEEVAQRPASAFVAAFTDTNLVGGGDDEKMAFDPWRVSVSREPTGGECEWRVGIQDMARLGAFVRMHLGGDEGPSLLADVPAEKMDRESYSLGEAVYASVAPKDVRFVASSSMPNEPDHDEKEDS